MGEIFAIPSMGANILFNLLVISSVFFKTLSTSSAILSIFFSTFSSVLTILKTRYHIATVTDTRLNMAVIIKKVSKISIILILRLKRF